MTTTQSLHRRRASATTDPIVVAVDHSAESGRALAWALAQAERLGCRVVAVTACPPPVVTGERHALNWAEAYELAERAAADRARATIDRVAHWEQVDHIVEVGRPETVLAAHADRARMIVVGTRPKRRFWHEIRPSLTNRLTGMVDCPVVSISSNGHVR